MSLCTKELISPPFYRCFKLILYSFKDSFKQNKLEIEIVCYVSIGNKGYKTIWIMMIICKAVITGMIP